VAVFRTYPKEGKNYYKTMVADITTLEKTNMRLRHSEEKLAKLFKKLIPALKKLKTPRQKGEAP